MIIDDIVQLVRRRLGDTRKERWTDEQLILYTSLGQNDICVFTNFYKRIVLQPIYEGTTIYDLPKDVLRVERVEFAGYNVPMYSRNNLDDGNVRYPLVIKDDLPYGTLEFRLTDQGPGIFPDFEQFMEDAYGVTSDFDWLKLEDMYGVVSDITNIEPPEDLPERVGYYTLFYSAVPDVLYSLTDELVLPDIWLSTLLHYVSGMALQDDNDAANIERGELELRKYQRLLAEIFKTSAKDFTTNVKDKMTTKYRRI